MSDYADNFIQTFKMRDSKRGTHSKSFEPQKTDKTEDQTTIQSQEIRRLQQSIELLQSHIQQLEREKYLMYERGCTKGRAIGYHLALHHMQHMPSKRQTRTPRVPDLSCFVRHQSTSTEQGVPSTARVARKQLSETASAPVPLCLKRKPHTPKAEQFLAQHIKSDTANPAKARLLPQRVQQLSKDSMPSL